MEISLNRAAEEIRKVSSEHGFYAGWGNVPEKLMLIVTELAEAMEMYRKIKLGGYSLRVSLEPHPILPLKNQEELISKFSEELADVQIRLLDLTAALGIDLEKAILEKHEYNKTRPYKHGKER